jgi:hypothetical protein
MMGLFDWFKGKIATQPDASELPIEEGGSEIPKGLFVEEAEPDEQGFQNGTLAADIDSVFDFMRRDLESKGYHHALVNPDESYCNANIRLIQFEIRIRIQRSKLYYNDRIKEVDHHIETRTQAGLHDLAKELGVRKKIYVDHLALLDNMLKESESEGSVVFRAALSYQTGFKNGLAAITQARILNGEEC